MGKLRHSTEKNQSSETAGNILRHAVDVSQYTFGQHQEIALKGKPEKTVSAGA